MLPLAERTSLVPTRPWSGHGVTESGAATSGVAGAHPLPQPECGRLQEQTTAPVPGHLHVSIEHRRWLGIHGAERVAVVAVVQAQHADAGNVALLEPVILDVLAEGHLQRHLHGGGPVVAIEHPRCPAAAGALQQPRRQLQRGRVGVLGEHHMTPPARRVGQRMGDDLGEPGVKRLRPPACTRIKHRNDLAHAPAIALGPEHRKVLPAAAVHNRHVVGGHLSPARVSRNIPSAGPRAEPRSTAGGRTERAERGAGAASR